MGDVMFQRGAIRITDDRLEYGGSTYPLDLIESAVSFQMPFEFGGMAINAVLAFAGLWGLTFFNLWGVGLGVIAIAIGGFNLYNGFLKREHYLSVDLHNGQTVRISSTDGDLIRDAYNALEHARGVR